MIKGQQELGGKRKKIKKRGGDVELNDFTNNKKYSCRITSVPIPIINGGGLYDSDPRRSFDTSLTDDKYKYTCPRISNNNNTKKGYEIVNNNYDGSIIKYKCHSSISSNNPPIIFDNGTSKFNCNKYYIPPPQIPVEMENIHKKYNPLFNEIRNSLKKLGGKGKKRVRRVLKKKVINPTTRMSKTEYKKFLNRKDGEKLKKLARMYNIKVTKKVNGKTKNIKVENLRKKIFNCTKFL